MIIDVLDRDELPFSHSLPEFQRLFPDEAASAAYLCPHCAVADEPRYISTRRSVLRCRHCRRDTSLTAGTVMERTHTPLSVWLWAAYLVASQTLGMSADQFQPQLGLSRYETAFQILHKLRAGMVRPDQDRIGGKPEIIVEAHETGIGGRTRGNGRTSTIWSSWPKPSKSCSASAPAVSTSVRTGVTPDASASLWYRSGVQSRWSALLKAPWRRVLPLLPTTGVAMQRAENADTFIPPSQSAATWKSRKTFCPSSISCSPISIPGCAAYITVSALNTCKPISTNSPTVLTGASTHSMPSDLYLASRAMSPLRPMLSCTLQNYETLHLVGGCDNRIST